MDETIDAKIRSVLSELRDATQYYSENIIKPVLNGNEGRVTNHDFFELALAQDKINLLETQYKLYLAEESPERFTQQEKDFLLKEKERFTKRIRAWENRQFPSREE